jgi:hypothetical protein
MSHASQRKTSTETRSPVEDQRASPSLGQLGSGKTSRKNRRGKSGDTPAGNVALCGNGLAEDALPDASELSRQIAEIAQKSQELGAEFLKRQAA